MVGLLGISATQCGFGLFADQQSVGEQGNQSDSLDGRFGVILEGVSGVRHSRFPDTRSSFSLLRVRTFRMVTLWGTSSVWSSWRQLLAF